ncbi:DUF262 domain-containing protein [Pseudarthrobacter sp. H3Y2-7]|uniref:DUF262 domain-containing protein n=1 Tax=Pseudarthrobacter naphthalenicus TaxID=3031328 RepID=UPI0023B0DBBF|nr:DUF262 domain-containing protein [Pseudarthrobacter sp. H3Y2-7]MDE8669829.1 DUF262 domain-containing protein [Pseudarthrobacter sp. H3Y2-7]
MKFNTQDPDIETIYRRISDADYDLQPDFQRGEVWTLKKQQRLIDTVLRGWHIPPVHLVARPEGTSDVLDGQQRLTAIRDFMDGAFSVDGFIEPEKEELLSLNGLRFQQLPPSIKRNFRKFTIRIFELTDYDPDEPHELFFRLNQPTNLTEAEKRNAFIGGPRNQIKSLVTSFSKAGLSKERIGFSNARMAYDDLLGRLMLTMENRSLTEKITAGRITARYRQADEFPNDIVDDATNAVRFILASPMLDSDVAQIRPNKATIHTWLCLVSRSGVYKAPQKEMNRFYAGVEWIERNRWEPSIVEDAKLATALRIFHDRSTARVADVSSVVLRDLCGAILLTCGGFWEPTLRTSKIVDEALFALDLRAASDRELYQYAHSVGWGESWSV